MSSRGCRARQACIHKSCHEPARTGAVHENLLAARLEMMLSAKVTRNGHLCPRHEAVQDSSAARITSTDKSRLALRQCNIHLLISASVFNIEFYRQEHCGENYGSACVHV